MTSRRTGSPESPPQHSGSRKKIVDAVDACGIYVETCLPDIIDAPKVALQARTAVTEYETHVPRVEEEVVEEGSDGDEGTETQSESGRSAGSASASQADISPPGEPAAGPPSKRACKERHDSQPPPRRKTKPARKGVMEPMDYERHYRMPTGRRAVMEDDAEEGASREVMEAASEEDAIAAAARLSNRQTRRTLTEEVNTLAVYYGARDVLAGSLGRLHEKNVLDEYKAREEFLPPTLPPATWADATGNVQTYLFSVADMKASRRHAQRVFRYVDNRKMKTRLSVSSRLADGDDPLKKNARHILGVSGEEEAIEMRQAEMLGGGTLFPNAMLHRLDDGQRDTTRPPYGAAWSGALDRKAVQDSNRDVWESIFNAPTRRGEA